MIITQVRFELDEPISLADVTAIFRKTAPKYKGHAGLKKKHYVRSEDGRTVGAIYFWESRADAERTYDAAWRHTVSETYGAVPQITYFDAPVVVDNEADG